MLNDFNMGANGGAGGDIASRMTDAVEYSIGLFETHCNVHENEGPILENFFAAVAAYEIMQVKEVQALLSERDALLPRVQAATNTVWKVGHLPYDTDHTHQHRVEGRSSVRAPRQREPRL